MKSLILRLLFGVLVLVTASPWLLAQNAPATTNPLKSLSPKNLLKGKPVRLTGMLTGNHVYYNATGIPNRNVPFNVLYTGNLTLDILGKIKMPVSFSLSNQTLLFSHPFDQQYQFRQPFNRLLLKPTYKGFTLHLGTCALIFSPYTLAGHRYDGIGLEYKNPKKPFYAGLMMGNLQRAIKIDSSFLTRPNIPSYRRIGMGVQLGYKKQEDRAEIIFFTAKDERNSLPYSLDDRNILPQQNAVVSLKGAKVFKKKLQLSSEIAFSGVTNDQRAPQATRASSALLSFMGALPVKTSTDFRKALKAELLYRGKTFNTGFQYSRVDPNYRTLGAYYFVNDLETFQTKLATQLLKGKLTLSANAGLQQDNVQKQNLKTNRRWVGASNISFVPNQKMNFQLSYSNFTNYSNLRPVYDYLRQITPYNALDTLNFRQINQNAMIMGSFTLPTASKDITQTLSFNGVFQRGSDQQASVLVQNNLANLSLDYAYQHTPKKMMLAAAWNFSQSNLSNMPMTQWGPSLSFGKGLSEKWKTNLNGLLTWGRMTGVKERTINARWGLTGQLSEEANLLFNLIYMNRNAQSTDRFIPSFQELTATLGFSYNFSIIK